jgi:AcrR family transcriptional regulator
LIAEQETSSERVAERPLADELDVDWQRRVVGRSLHTAAERSVDRGMNFIRAAAAVLARANGEDITVQEVADEAGQSLRTLYQYFESKDDLLLAVFEEAMRTYARLIEAAIAALEDPLERVAGAMVAAVRMPEVSGASLDRGLIRLRLKLSDSRPERVGRAQSAVSSLVLALVEAAVAAKQLHVEDAEGATFLILAVNASVITAEVAGNDAGVRRPDIEGVTSFCLRGLGADLAEDWFQAVSARLRLPTPLSRPVTGRGVQKAKKAPARRRSAG